MGIKDTEKDAQLTLRDIERIIVGFIVDKHNQANVTIARLIFFVGAKTC
jgi:hypothetical protein